MVASVITLQDIVNCFEYEEDHYHVTIFSDCCYSGAWCSLLDKENPRYNKPKALPKVKLWLKIYAATGEDERGTEMVFTNLLKGQLPQEGG